MGTIPSGAPRLRSFPEQCSRDYRWFWDCQDAWQVLLHLYELQPQHPHFNHLSSICNMIALIKNYCIYIIFPFKSLLPHTISQFSLAQEQFHCWCQFKGSCQVKLLSKFFNHSFMSVQRIIHGASEGTVPCYIWTFQKFLLYLL